MHARRADRPRRARRFPALIALLTACLLATAGCGPLVPSPAPSSSRGSASPSLSIGPSTSPSATGTGSASPNPDAAAVYAAIERQVVALRGLQAKSPIEPQILDTTELKVRVEEAFKRDNPPAVVAANERLLKGLGLFPKDASLSGLYLELLGSQVAGFYSPEDKKLFVVSKSGALGPVEQVTFSHEYTHALQDQNFNLKSFDLDAVGQGDRGLARLSLIEGDATALMGQWAQANLTPDQLMEMVRVSLDPEALKILEKMPPILREPLSFPYDNGLRFVMRLQQRGGWKAVDAAFRNAPQTTEQVLHPEKWDAGEPPVVIDVPKDLDTRMGAGWKVGLQDTLGEFQIGIWVRIGVTRVPLATAAAAGWGGDRVVLLDGPNGAWAIAMLTSWDTAADATEFADGAGQVLNKLGTPGTVYGRSGSKTVTVLLGSDAAAATKLDTILGETGA